MKSAIHIPPCLSLDHLRILLSAGTDKTNILACQNMCGSTSLCQNYFLGTPYTLTEDRPAAVFQLLIEPDFFVR